MQGKIMQVIGSRQILFTFTMSHLSEYISFTLTHVVKRLYFNIANKWCLNVQIGCFSSIIMFLFPIFKLSCFYFLSLRYHHRTAESSEWWEVVQTHNQRTRWWTTGGWADGGGLYQCDGTWLQSTGVWKAHVQVPYVWDRSTRHASRNCASNLRRQLKWYVKYK